MQFLMIVDDPEIARYVAAHGVARLFVDLEHMGKQDRQGHLASWKSRQTVSDVSRIREAAPDAHLLVRINPLHPGSAAEIADVVMRGADSVMLPMFHGPDDLERFLDMLAHRAEAVPLVETASALHAVPDLLQGLAVTRLHIGLNDLHLDLNMDFMFEPLSKGLLEAPCAALREAGVAFGIGGIARAGEGLITPERVLGEHVRLGSTATIISRSFHRGAQTLDELLDSGFDSELAKLQAIYTAFRAADEADLQRNRAAVWAEIEEVAARVRASRSAC